MPINVLHIIERLTLGGASRALLASAAYSTRKGLAKHRVVSLLPVQPAAVEQISMAGLALAPTVELSRWIGEADIVHIHFWNNPDLYKALESDLSAARIILTCHVGGLTAPQILTPEVVDFADSILATSRHTLEEADDALLRKALYAPSAADFGRLAAVAPSPHDFFNIGYIGTVDFGKMHPRYAAMHAAIEIPEARVIVCGHGAASAVLAKQSAALGVAHRFDFRGYVEDIAPVLSIMDVFGYPLCEDNYSTSELILQEVMFAGIPSVVFSDGGAARVIVDGETGFVANSEDDYIERISYLHRHPDVRAKMGASASVHARARLGIENLAPLVDAAYNRLMDMPKCVRFPLAPLQGAKAFIRSLGTAGDVFRVSQSAELTSAMAADETIAHASPALASASGGGVLHYRRSYPKDPMLRLWSGLVLLGQQRPALAASEFKAAIKLGCQDSRGFLYLSRAVQAASGNALADESVIRGSAAYQ
jgi:glycosyltransferase involved in cell wall biosynthesis